MTRFLLFLLLPFGLLAQTPDCTQKGALTTATTFTALPNNTGNPICSAFVLVWNSTGFTGVTIQLEGSDTIAGSYTAFTAATPFANPTTALSGAIVIQATTKLAFVRVNVSSVTGTGAVNFQINGYRGVTPVAGGSGGSGCGTLGGDLSGTCAAATVVGIEGHPVSGVQGNGALAQLSTGSTTTSDCVIFDANGNTTDSGSPTCGGLAAALISIFGNTGPNITALLVPTGDSLGPSGTGTITATQVPTGAGATAATDGQLKYDTTANNLHAGVSSGDSIIPVIPTPVTYVAGHCLQAGNVGNSLSIVDSGTTNCGGGSGSSPTFPVNAQTATYQATAADFAGCKTISVASGTFNLTLVASGSQPSNGQCIWVVNYGSGVVTIVRSGQNINGGTASLTVPAASATAPTGAFVVSDAANYEAVLFGGSTGGSSAFNAITSGTNTTATMKVGAGAILEPDSTGIMASGAHWPNPVTGGNTTTIPLTGWTLQNTANAHGQVNDFFADQIVLSAGNFGTDQWAGYTRTISVPYTIYAHVRVGGACGTPTNFGTITLLNGGVVISDGTKYEGLVETCSTSSSNPTYSVITLATLSSAASTVAGPTAGTTGLGNNVSVKIVNNSTNRIWSYWSNGAWVTFLTEATGTFLTETAAGIVVGSDVTSGGYLIEAYLLYWSVQ